MLVTLTPRMYRQAIALWLARSRPAFEVRIASPEHTKEEVRTFGPHLLIRNDTDGLEPGMLAGVPCQVEVIYSDGMDARIHLLDGQVEKSEDMSTERPLRVADEAANLMGRP